MKVLRGFAAAVVVIMILSVVAFSVKHILSRGKMFGKASGAILEFASFPHKINEAISQVTAKVKNYQLVVDHRFKSVNQLDTNVYGLISYNSDNADYLVLKLVNFKTDSIVHEWKCPKVKITTEGLCSNHPILLDDYSIIFKLDYDLYRLDSNSKLTWLNESMMFHHTLEMDHEGNIWSPATIDNGVLNLNSKVVNYGTDLPFRDEYITKIDPATGTVLFSKSVAEILIENNYTGLVYGFWQYDPIHLNDIEPVLNDSKYWKKGDLFLSCRNLHTILLYRPSTGKIIWLRTGLWVNQHDVDLKDSTHITVLNNNVNQNMKELLYKDNSDGEPSLTKTLEIPTSLNSIVVYDFENDSTSELLPELMKREKIDAQSQGIFMTLSNGDYFIEETDQGKFFIGNNERTLFKMQLVSPDSSFGYYPGWSRVYEKIPVK